MKTFRYLIRASLVALVVGVLGCGDKEQNQINTAPVTFIPKPVAGQGGGSPNSGAQPGGAGGNPAKPEQ